jgi:hypothetical protein
MVFEGVQHWRLREGYLPFVAEYQLFLYHLVFPLLFQVKLRMALVELVIAAFLALHHHLRETLF